MGSSHRLPFAGGGAGESKLLYYSRNTWYRDTWVYLRSILPPLHPHTNSICAGREKWETDFRPFLEGKENNISKLKSAGLTRAVFNVTFWSKLGESAFSPQEYLPRIFRPKKQGRICLLLLLLFISPKPKRCSNSPCVYPGPFLFPLRVQKDFRRPPLQPDTGGAVPTKMSQKQSKADK